MSRPRHTSNATSPDKSYLASLTLTEASKLVQEGIVTPTQLTEAILGQISTYDAQLNSYITVLGEDALTTARELDFEQSIGSFRGPLHGIPIALKDNIDTAGVPTTAASGVYRERIPAHDAAVTRRLRDAGAIILGKLNLHEFAAGGTGHTSAFGSTRNPWDLDRVPGGSSSGSGCSVAAELCFAALGTDTGGSIRIPSSWCGVVGMKPTYGLVSIRGIVPLIYSLDHCGPMARSVDDVAIMLTGMAGYDPFDPASIDHPNENYVAAATQSTTGFRLATPEEFYGELDPEIALAINAAIDLLTSLTSGVVSHKPLPACGNLLDFFAETLTFHDSYLRETPELYQPPTRRFLSSFPPLLAADYIASRNALIELRHTIDCAFSNFDLVVLPTQRLLPFTIAEAAHADSVSQESGLAAPQQFLTIANTFQFNMYGLPALSIPCGFSASGLPIGMTIAGPRFSEGKILALARAFEAATNWHKRRPPLLL